MTVSILIGYVRIAVAETWADACRILREDIKRTYPQFMNEHAQRHYEYELGQLSLAPDHGMLMTSGSWAWPGTTRVAIEGETGIAAGHLATVREYSNGSYGYTVDVKCKVLSIDGSSHRATVRITGDSLQFTRRQVITMPGSFLRPRATAERR